MPQGSLFQADLRLTGEPEAKPGLLLHVCCGPCATHPLNLLKENYRITGYYFNPNIFPFSEYQKRLAEVEKLFHHLDIPLIIPEYNHETWLARTKHLSGEREGGARCALCFDIRLQHTAAYAAAHGFSAFTSTLTIGPNKPARVIFPIAEKYARQHHMEFLAMDFKKKEGFKISCKLSRDMNMYRQDYCGCEFSLRDRRNRSTR